MKKVTLRADEELIDQARQVARANGTTLNDAFRAWLIQYVGGAAAGEVHSLMSTLRYVRAGGHFSRDRMNER